jgi:RNA polymerase sigma factor (sigma-70 family)
MIPIARPDLGPEEIAAVGEVISSGMIAQGKRVAELERRWAEFVGTKHAVAFSNGTTALMSIFQGLGLAPGDEVITVAHTFAATANAILYTGATPVFVDIEPETYLIDAARIEAAITPQTRAIAPVHLFGLVARLVPDRDQASDVVQETFFSAYRNLAAFRGGSVRSWLGRIAVNAAMDTQRARKRRPAQPYPELEDETWQPPAPDTAEPERTAVLAERNRLLGDALATITMDQRTAIVLYDVEGYDYQEIADLTGVSLGTVKSRIHRGRLALRALLEGRMELPVMDHKVIDRPLYGFPVLKLPDVFHHQAGIKGVRMIVIKVCPFFKRKMAVFLVVKIMA